GDDEEGDGGPPHDDRATRPAAAQSSGNAARLPGTCRPAVGTDSVPLRVPVVPFGAHALVRRRTEAPASPAAAGGGGPHARPGDRPPLAIVPRMGHTQSPRVRARRALAVLATVLAAALATAGPAAAQGPFGPLNDLLALGQGEGQKPDTVGTQRNDEPPFVATP